MSKIKVSIIEDRDDITVNLRKALNGLEDIELVACYGAAEEAIKSLETDDADIYLVDLGLPGISGVEFISQASHTNTKADFIVHTISENGRDLISALSAGAVGYIIKGCPDGELIDGIRAVANGGGLISPRLARRLFHYFKDTGAEKKPLTKTEMEVLNQLKTGVSYEGIAVQKNVSLSTIQSHIKSIYKKLNVNNRKDALITGSMFGLLDNDDDK